MMRTSMKAIVAAVGAAIIAYPVQAESVVTKTVPTESWRNAKIPPSIDNVFWGLLYERPAYQLHPAYGHPYGYGSVAPPSAHQPAAGEITDVVRPRFLDCVHVTFPQCGSGGG
jgi:hypothetical protein